MAFAASIDQQALNTSAGPAEIIGSILTKKYCKLADGYRSTHVREPVCLFKVAPAEVLTWLCLPMPAIYF